ncbi:hypothetical protein C8Q76DRAFT_790706 [Earliella scabrosa]|nr:hypothetical protein C8Q76DRAFT_790706 [Earliella scabrosa]
MPSAPSSRATGTRTRAARGLPALPRISTAPSPRVTRARTRAAASAKASAPPAAVEATTAPTTTKPRRNEWGPTHEGLSEEEMMALAAANVDRDAYGFADSSGEPIPQSAELASGPKQVGVFWANLTPHAKQKRRLDGAARLVRKQLAAIHTQAATDHMQAFKLKAAARSPSSPSTAKMVEPAGRVWDGAMGRRAVSADKMPLLYFLPELVQNTTRREVTSAILRYAEHSPPSTKLASDKSFPYKDGFPQGTHVIATCWHAIGRPHDEPGPASSMRATVQSFNGACEVMARLTVLDLMVDKILATVDPAFYASIQRLHKWRMDNFASSRAFDSLSPVSVLHEGREIQYNRFSARHVDLRDPHFTWVVIFYLGDFGEATLEFRQLGIRIILRPGAAVAFRGRELVHEGLEWARGNRYLVIYFTHSALWEQATMSCGASEAVLDRDATTS